VTGHSSDSLSIAGAARRIEPPVPTVRVVQKIAAAERLRDEIGIERPILVDDLEGTVHRAYGLLPNMSWVLGRGRTILYKAMWTWAVRIADFLTRFEAQPLDLAHAPFFTAARGASP
jgi:hypothetical protein